MGDVCQNEKKNVSDLASLTFSGLITSFRKLGQERRQMPDGYENVCLLEGSQPYNPQERIVANLASYSSERRSKLLAVIRQELEQKPMTVAQRLRM